MNKLTKYSYKLMVINFWTLLIALGLSPSWVLACNSLFIDEGTIKKIPSVIKATENSSNNFQAYIDAYESACKEQNELMTRILGQMAPHDPTKDAQDHEVVVIDNTLLSIKKMIESNYSFEESWNNNSSRINTNPFDYLYQEVCQGRITHSYIQYSISKLRESIFNGGSTQFSTQENAYPQLITVFEGKKLVGLAFYEYHGRDGFTEDSVVIDLICVAKGKQLGEKIITSLENKNLKATNANPGSLKRRKITLNSIANPKTFSFYERMSFKVDMSGNSEEGIPMIKEIEFNLTQRILN